ncbi:hypothetical protein OAU51_03580 [Porticoccaceae bacterium]|nr:hypothetical protein [Porticoccaceae bacterium]
MGLFKFLKSLRTLANNRNITIEEAYKFAKQEFGEVTDLLKLQINKIFKDVEAPSIKMPEKPKNNVFTLIPKDKRKDYLAKMEEPPSQKSGTIMDRLSGAANKLEELMKEREAMYKPKKGLDLSEGLTRSLARKILDRKKIQIPKGQDPINVFTDIFGESISDVNNLAEEMIEIDARGGGMKNMDEMLESEGLYDIEIPESPQRGMTDEELEKFMKEKPEEPEDFATGGRVGLKGGGSYDYTSFDHKINELLAAYKRYKKGSATGGRKGILTFEQFFPLFAAENFAEGGSVFDRLERDVPYPEGHRVDYGKGGAVKEGIKALIEKINKKFGKGTVKLGKDIKRPESAEMREAFLEFKKRQGFAYGSGKKLVQVLKTLGTDLKKEIKKAVNDLIPSGDPKLDADMALDNMLEDLNIDRDAIDQYDILDAYGLAYDEITRPLLKELKNKPKSSPKTADEVKKEAVEKYGIKPERADEIMNTEFDEEKILADVDEAYGVTPDMKKELDKMNMKYEGEEFDRLYDDYLYYKNEEGNFTGSFEDFIKARRQAGSLDAEMIKLKKLGAPKMAERFELKQKYPGIDDKLLTQIIDDPDPQRKAEVLATIDQAFELMKQGKSHEEVLDIMKKRTDRTKQAGGGLAYLMGL